MHFQSTPSMPETLLESVERYCRRLPRDFFLDGMGRDDLAQDLLVRLLRRGAIVMPFPHPWVRRILRQGMSSILRTRNARKRRPPKLIGRLSSLDTLSGWQPIDPSANGVAASDFELDWVVILATFDRREVRLIERWRDNDWRKPPGLSKRQRRQFEIIRARLAERLVELGYFAGGDLDDA